MIKIFFLTLFLSSSIYTFAHTGGLASSGANKCSKAFKSSDQKTAQKGGIIKRLSRFFTKEPPPTILDELNNPNLTIGVAVWAYLNSGYKLFPDNRQIVLELGLPPIIPIPNDRIHTPYYTFYYQPVNKLMKRGLFVLVFSTNVQIRGGYLSSFRHIIVWESDVRNTHLDESTVRQIFETLYKGDPNEIAQQNYNKIEFDPYGHEIIEPLLFRDSTDKVREAIINALQESTTTDTTITSTNG